MGGRRASHRLERHAVIDPLPRGIFGAEQGDALNQSIVCASESYRIDITSFAEASGGVGPGRLEGSPHAICPAT